MAKLFTWRQLFSHFTKFSSAAVVVVVILVDLVPKGCTANWQRIGGGSRIFWHGPRLPSACPGGKLLLELGKI